MILLIVFVSQIISSATVSASEVKTPATSVGKSPDYTKIPHPGLSQPPASVPDEDNPDSPWYVPEWVDTLIKKIDGMLQMFKDLMSGKLIYDAVEGFVVSGIDEMLAPLFGTFAKSYLFTPRVAEIEIVYKAWSLFTIVGIASLLVGLLFLIKKVTKGRKDLKLLLKVFSVCIVATFLSLTILNITNVLVNMITQEALAGIVGVTDISYQGLDGPQILKAFIIGSEGITNPELVAKTLGQIVVDTEGGVFSLIGVVIFVVLPLFIVSVAKVLILIIIAIFVAVWISYTAWSGKYETLIGLFNLYIRTLIVGLICAIHWAVFVKLQTNYSAGEGISAEIGISPIIFSMLSVAVILLFLFFFWLRPIWNAVKDPVQLGGGKAVENMGKWGKKASLGMNAVGKRMGAETLQKKALDYADASQRMLDYGKNIQEQRSSSMSRIASSMTGGASEALQGITYSLPEKWLEENGSVISSNQYDLDLNETVISATAFTMREDLTDEGFTEAAVLFVEPEERAKMTKQLEVLLPEHKESVYWDEGTGELYMTNETPAMIDNLKASGFNVSSLNQGMSKEGAFVDLDRKTTRVLNNTKQTLEALDTVHEVLPCYTQAGLNTSQAKEAYDHLMLRESEFPWVSELSFNKGELWIPDRLIDVAKPVLDGIFSTKESQARLTLPRGSEYLDDMVDDWEKSGKYKDLLDTMEVDGNNNYVLVSQDQKAAFQKADAEYRKDRTPYWRTKDGKTMVIIDSQPVDNGQPPLKGLNMGSFEKLQANMHAKHQDSRSN